MSNYTLDDTGSSGIQYTGNWIQAGVRAEHASTTHGTKVKGSQAIVTFSGTSVAVYGTIGPSAHVQVVSTYDVDGLSPVTFTAPQTSSVKYQQLFYQSPSLENGQHTLTITFIGDGGNYWLDFIEVTQELDGPSLPSTSNPTPSKSSGAVGIETQTDVIHITKAHENVTTSRSLTTSLVLSSAATQMTSTTGAASLGTSKAYSSNPMSQTDSTSQSIMPVPSNVSNSTSQSTSAPIGAIVGGAVAGVLIVLGFVLFSWRFQRKKKALTSFPLYGYHPSQHGLRTTSWSARHPSPPPSVTSEAFHFDPTRMVATRSIIDSQTSFYSDGYGYTKQGFPEAYPPSRISLLPNASPFTPQGTIHSDTVLPPPLLNREHLDEPHHLRRHPFTGS